MNAALAVELLLRLLTQATAIGDLIKRAQSEGRDVTAVELDSLKVADDEARKRLQAAINDALNPT